MKVRYIDSFLFNKAEYIVSDEQGNHVLLIIEYRNNTYRLEGLTDTFDENVAREVEEVAKNLLTRKHNVNFAER